MNSRFLFPLRTSLMFIRWWNWFRVGILAGCGAALLYSCGGGNVNQPVMEESSQEFSRQGWVEYENDSYESAIQTFKRAVKMDPNHWEAYSGLGWAHFAQLELSEAAQNFIISLSLDSSKVDPIVGNVFISFERNKYNDALQWANKVFAIDSSQFLSPDAGYVFKHNSRVNARQVHKIVALCHYYLGEFEKSYNHMRLYLKPLLILYPGSAGFPQQLLEELKKL